MSVYRADDPGHFMQALDSVLNQSVLPEEIILVIDGPIGDALNSAVLSYEHNPLLKLLRLPTNLGPGTARHRAISVASSPIVAVMDSDDICMRNRFESQIKALENQDIDLVGAFIAEFLGDPEKEIRVRKVPLTHDKIVERGKFYFPINHVTIMFRKEAYFRSGGYRGFRKVEDYDLFHRMVISGLRFKNIPEVLVLVRSSDAQYRRRHGWSYFREEIVLHRDMFRSGYIGLTDFIRNIAIRLPVRLLPVAILRGLSKNYLRSREN
jgi:glycosyltransferase involved in cell wall biosynthesis